MKPDIITLGCRANLAEAEALAAVAGANPAFRVVVNTCAVTNEAARQSAQATRRAARAHPGAVAAVGCASALDPARFRAIDGVALVLGAQDKTAPEAWRSSPQTPPAQAAVSQAMGSQAMGSRPRHSPRAWLRAQDGCDHACTFCATTLARGASRSAPIAAIVHEAARLVRAGALDITLTGIDLASWGADLPGSPDLYDVARALLGRLPGLARLRFSSLDPAVLARSARLVAMFREPRIAPQVHVSLQSGDGIILKRMKRRHTPEDCLRVAEALRAARPELVLSADVIAGFPTETDAMFARTLALLEAMAITRVHAFAFSSRSGTPSARMPQTSFVLRRARAEQARVFAREQEHARLLRLAGARRWALMETARVGRLADGTKVRFATDIATPWARARLLGADGASGDALATLSPTLAA